MEPMRKRAIWKVIVYGLLTLGIYDLVWLARTRNEMATKGQNIPPFWILFLPLLILIAVVFMEFVVRLAGRDSGGMASASAMVGIVNALAMTIGLLAFIALLPLSIYWTYRYCRAVENVSNGTISVGMSLTLWIILTVFNLAFIWPAIIQDGFNKIGGTPPPPPQLWPEPGIPQQPWAQQQMPPSPPQADQSTSQQRPPSTPA